MMGFANFREWETYARAQGFEIIIEDCAADHTVYIASAAGYGWTLGCFYKADDSVSWCDSREQAEARRQDCLESGA